MCLAVGFAAFAQSPERVLNYDTDEHTVYFKKGNSNWFISAGGGIQMFWGDHDSQAMLRDRMTPAFEFTVGKWISSHFGARIAANGYRLKGVTQHYPENAPGIYSTGVPYKDMFVYPHYLQHQQFDYFNIHADVMFNVVTILVGDRPWRVWDLVPAIGLGWAHVVTKPGSDALTMNAGLMNSFIVSDSFALYIDVRGMVAMDQFDGDTGGRPFDGLVSASLGLTYTFQPKRK